MVSDNYTPEQLAEAANLYPYTWTLQNKIKNEVGLPLDFSKRPWLKAIYNDLSPRQAFLKPPQIGATVMNTLKSLWVAKNLRRQIIYTLPTQGDVQDMVGGSFNRIIAQNPILMEWVRDHDTVEQKSVGESMIFYRGTFTSKQAMMIPSGLNIHDEVDASDPNVIVQYENRLQAQEDGGWRWYFSHPSLSGHGVDVYWQQSDKKEWYITCSKCDTEQTLQWPQNVDIDRERFICSHCKETLSEEDRAYKGRWKNQDGVVWTGEIAGDYLFSGWHVSQLMLYNKTAKQIIDAYNDPLKDKQYFYNYVLGLPYVDSDDRIDPAVVLRNCVDIVNDQTDRVVIGADTGHGIHFVCMNKQGVFYYEHATTISASQTPYDRIKELLKRWPKSIAVFDQGGDLIGVRQLQAEYPGRVFLCFYNKDRKSIEPIEWGSNDEYWKVRVDRNRMMTLVVEQLRDTGRIILNGTKDEWADFAAMFGNMYREKIVAKEQKGKDDRTLYGSEYVWKRNGPDHFCFIAGTRITTSEGEKSIEDIKVGDLVLTRKGYKRVYHAGTTKEDNVYTAYFSNGASFTATGDHPIIHSQGKERLDTLNRHAILYSCKTQKVLYTTGLLTEDTQTTQLVATEYISLPMEHTEQKGIKGFISKYGLIPMALFLKGMSYTTQTIILLITKLQTWCVFQGVNTNQTTSNKIFKTQSIGITTINILKASGTYPTTGGRLRRERNGTQNTLLKLLYSANQKGLTVLSVVQKLLHEAIKAVSFVEPDVRLVGMHENGERHIVYNLSVEEEPEYFANGILVSNCHAFLYAMVGMQRFGGGEAKVVGDNVYTGMQSGRIVQAPVINSFAPESFTKENQVLL